MGLTALREMIWTSSYLALGPVIASTLHEQFPSTFGEYGTASMQQRTLASLAGSIMAGLVTVYATQPVDTLKTVLQGQLAEATQQQPKLRTISKTLWMQGGFRHYYRGTVARGTRLIGAVFILGQARNVFETQFKKHNVLT